MELKMYSIRDSKGETYNTPFFQKTHLEAERAFHRTVNDPQSMVFMYPDDYDLYFVGEFDLDKGMIKALDTPQHLTKAVNLKTPNQKP